MKGLDAHLDAQTNRHLRELETAERADEAFVDWRDALTPAEEVEYMRAWMDWLQHNTNGWSAWRHYDEFLRKKWDALPRETGPDYFGDET